jgi:hypothetical protein
MLENKEKWKNVLDADDYLGENILSRATKSAALKSEKFIEDVKVGSRCKKHRKSKAGRK